MATKPRGNDGPGKDTALTYFCLITMTAKGKERLARQALADRTATTQAVKAAGGECRLFSTAGSAYDYVSVMTNITAVDAIRIAEFIESSGNRLVTMLPGTPVRK